MLSSTFPSVFDGKLLRVLHVDHAHDGALVMDDVWWLDRADYKQAGSDLIITGPEGQEILIVGFFTSPEPLSLTGEFGLHISAHMIKALVGSRAPQHFAQAGPTELGAPVGTIETLEGQVTVLRSDGNQVEAQVGDLLYQGDIIETSENGLLGATFSDESSLALDGGARLAIAQFIYDDADDVGQAVFSLLNGAMSFVSGQISKVNPDATVIDTPISTIGIRGTSLLVSHTPSPGPGIAPTSGVIIVPELDGNGNENIGQAVVRTQGGVVVLDDAFSGTSVSNAQTPPTAVQTVSLTEIGQVFGRAVMANPSPNTVPPALRNTMETLVNQRAAEEATNKAELALNGAQDQALQNQQQLVANADQLQGAQQQVEALQVQLQALPGPAQQAQLLEQISALESQIQGLQQIQNTLAQQQNQLDQAVQQAENTLTDAAQNLAQARLSAETSVNAFAQSQNNPALASTTNLTGAAQTAADPDPTPVQPENQSFVEPNDAPASDTSAQQIAPSPLQTPSGPNLPPEGPQLLQNQFDTTREDTDGNNRAPVVINTYSNSMNEDSGYIRILRSDIITRHIGDPDGQGVNILGLTVVGGRASVTRAADGSYWDVTPSSNFAGTIELAIGLSDGIERVSRGFGRITVTGVDDAPVANTYSISGDEDTNITFTRSDVINQVTEVDGDTITVNLVAGQTLSALTSGFGLANGTLTYTAATQTFTFAPNSKYNGSFNVSYSISDGTTNDNGNIAFTVIPGADPIVIDLDGDTIELLAYDDGVLFDVDLDGEEETMGWVAPDDGLLVMDVNRDGVINGMSEILSPHFDDGETEVAQTDTSFDVLMGMDDNDDGRIDDQDAAFHQLSVWQDFNSDAISDPGELFSLTEIGLEAIELAYQETPGQLAGNSIMKTGSIQFVDGRRQDWVEVNFDVAKDAGSYSSVQNPDPADDAVVL